MIIQAAKDNNASIIGLSALMTTTMVKMKDVVEAVKENGLDSKVVIGGAVITGELTPRRSVRMDIPRMRQTAWL